VGRQVSPKASSSRRANFAHLDREGSVQVVQIIGNDFRENRNGICCVGAFGDAAKDNDPFTTAKVKPLGHSGRMLEGAPRQLFS
jgi:hypothetical protein